MRRPKSNNEAGMTFVELMVAATLMGLFVLFLAPAGQMLYGVLDDVDRRTGNFQGVQLTRARFFADAGKASSIGCVAGDRVVMTVGASPATTIEYRRVQDRLIRWVFPPDKEFLVADGLSAIRCTSFGEEGLAVDLDMGRGANPLHLHMMVAEVAQGS